MSRLPLGIIFDVCRRLRLVGLASDGAAMDTYLSRQRRRNRTALLYIGRFFH